MKIPSIMFRSCATIVVALVSMSLYPEAAYTQFTATDQKSATQIKVPTATVYGQDRGGGADGTIRYIGPDGQPKEISGSPGRLRNIDVFEIDPTSDPTFRGAIQRLQRLRFVIPDLADEMLAALTKKPWRIDYKPIDQNCEPGLETIRSTFSSLGLVACQGPREIRI